MCFGSRSLKGPTFDDDTQPARIASTKTEPKNEDADPTKEDSRKKKSHEYNDGYGESMGLDLFAQRQKRLREQYPDRNIPEEVQRINASGMVQGNLGGPLGGGAGMAMSAGF